MDANCPTDSSWALRAFEDNAEIPIHGRAAGIHRRTYAVADKGVKQRLPLPGVAPHLAIKVINLLQLAGGATPPERHFFAFAEGIGIQQEIAGHYFRNCFP